MNVDEKIHTVDPATIATVWNNLIAKTTECGDRVMFACQSPVMALVRDLGAVLLTPDCEIVALPDFSPGHTLVADIAVREILKVIKKEELEPGDMILANDAHIIKSAHLCDWTFTVPIFWQRELVFLGHFKGHMLDTGGAFSGAYFPRAYDCIAEGLNIPPIKIIKKGKVEEPLRDLILDNVRTPPAQWADVMLIYSSLQQMGQDVCNLIEKFGLDTIKACISELFQRSEMATRDMIKSIPDGTYQAEAAVDWDGTTPNKQVWVRLDLIVRGDEMTLDFSNSDDQVDFINSHPAPVFGRALSGIYLLFNPDFPHNHGALVPIKMIAPEGKVINPKRPATYGGSGPTTSKAAMECAMLALEKAIPERAMGLWSRHFSPDVQGRRGMIDPRTGNKIEYFIAPFIEEGGSGAVKGYDGWEGIGPGILLNTIKRGSIEENELFFPIHRYDITELAPNTEGPGEFIGGRGIYAERVGIEEPGSRTFIQTGCNDGDSTPVLGVAGAPAGSTGEMYLQQPGQSEREVLRTMEIVEVFPGHRLTVKTMGGGGWGNPLDRDPEKIKFDVMEELISFERAKQVYGVVCIQKDSENPETIEVDYEATRELRESMRRKE